MMYIFTLMIKNKFDHKDYANNLIFKSHFDQNEVRVLDVVDVFILFLNEESDVPNIIIYERNMIIILFDLDMHYHFL